MTSSILETPAKARTPDVEFYDTDSLRLLQHGLTLSRRGVEWCLDAADVNITCSVTPALREVPVELRKLVRAYTRDGELIPVAKLNTRSAADLRAAVGDRLAVVRRSCDGSAREVALEYVRAQIGALALADLSIRLEQPEGTHRLRAAAQRLDSVFGTYATVLGGRTLLRGLRGELSWLTAQLGPTRDVEVQRDRMIGLLDRTESQYVVGPVRLAVDQYFGRLAEVAKAQFTAALESPRYLQVLNALDVLEVVLSEESRGEWGKQAVQPAAKVLPKLVDVAADKAAKRIAQVRKPGDAKARRARTSVKHLRCAIEAAAGSLRPVTPDVLDDVRALQRVLGEHRAARVAQRHLRTLGDLAAGVGDSGFTYGLLSEAETAAAERCLGAVPAAWYEVRRDLRVLRSHRT